MITPTQHQVYMHPVPKNDCMYLYFDLNGRWDLEGHGWFPRTEGKRGRPQAPNRQTIMEANNGALPGLVKGAMAHNLCIIVMPYDCCDQSATYPWMLHPIESEK